MIKHSLSRTELLVGTDGINKLKDSKVVVFGVGGVGSFVVEALTRAGIGEIIIVDNDTVDITNINRQIHATPETVGKIKVDVMADRILSINKECKVVKHQVFVEKDNIHNLIPDDADYVVDAIDTVTAKIALAEYCNGKNIRLISSMGTGNKFDPSLFKVADLYDTKVCPLAKVMRRELKRRGVDSLKVVYSEEVPQKPRPANFASDSNEDPNKFVVTKRQTPGSMSFVPPVAGMIIGGEVIKDIVGIK
ncbi:MAG: tRNA threonylcarbamoyladenosine dehydratase [Clostridium sp.]|nr:tRNA threonylcarbamoyladenosine dehydratase [Clostridium sp.]